MDFSQIALDIDSVAFRGSSGAPEGEMAVSWSSPDIGFGECRIEIACGKDPETGFATSEPKAVDAERLGPEFVKALFRSPSAYFLKAPSLS